MGSGAAGRGGGVNPRGRMGVVALGRLVAGPAFNNPNFLFRLAREDALAYFLGRRAGETIAKFQYALAQAFVLGERQPLLSVEGALLQHGKGHSSARMEDGKRYLSGTEAAHFGVGTITQRGEAYSVRSTRRMLLAARSAGVAGGDFPTRIGAGADLATMGLVHDAATYYAPAMINRAEGLLEGPKQSLLRGALPVVVAADPSGLESQIITISFQALEVLTGGAGGIGPIQERLRAIRGGFGKEIFQDPRDPDPGNRLFGLREATFLEATLAAYQDPGGAFARELEGVARRIPEQAHDMAQLAVQAREELAAIASGSAILI
ncbi:hypothetical protein [Paludisphaera soli]|uniref:hypothetical protein n=1 Tax=Paludisphaera soli TaxID=2712865 RepID=UPI0013EDABE7|nr:hypothetical protein [Paludisphaera soli]